MKDDQKNFCKKNVTTKWATAHAFFFFRRNYQNLSLQLLLLWYCRWNSNIQIQQKHINHDKTIKHFKCFIFAERIFWQFLIISIFLCFRDKEFFGRHKLPQFVVIDFSLLKQMMSSTFRNKSISVYIAKRHKERRKKNLKLHKSINYRN